MKSKKRIQILSQNQIMTMGALALRKWCRLSRKLAQLRAQTQARKLITMTTKSIDYVFSMLILALKFWMRLHIIVRIGFLMDIEAEY